MYVSYCRCPIYHDNNYTLWLFRPTTCRFYHHITSFPAVLSLSRYSVPSFPLPCLDAVTHLRFREQITNGGWSGCVIGPYLRTNQWVDDRCVNVSSPYNIVTTHPLRCVFWGILPQSQVQGDVSPWNKIPYSTVKLKELHEKTRQPYLFIIGYLNMSPHKHTDAQKEVNSKWTIVYLLVIKGNVSLSIFSDPAQKYI